MPGVVLPKGGMANEPQAPRDTQESRGLALCRTGLGRRETQRIRGSLGRICKSQSRVERLAWPPVRVKVARIRGQGKERSAGFRNFYKGEPWGGAKSAMFRGVV